MSYRIEIEPPARQEIRSLPGYVRAQAEALIDDDSQVISILRVRRKERIDYPSVEPPK